MFFLVSIICKLGWNLNIFLRWNFKSVCDYWYKNKSVFKKHDKQSKILTKFHALYINNYFDLLNTS